jgi:hypothetical protein
VPVLSTLTQEAAHPPARAGRKLRTPLRPPTEVEPHAAYCITVPVEQDSVAARLEAGRAHEFQFIVARKPYLATHRTTGQARNKLPFVLERLHKVRLESGPKLNGTSMTSVARKIRLRIRKSLTLSEESPNMAGVSCVTGKGRSSERILHLPLL